MGGMSVVGTSLASSVSASQQAERAQAKATEKGEREKRGPRETARDVYEHVEQVEGADPVRSLKGNEQEEAHEDRQEHAGYVPGGGAREEQDPPRIDVEV